ncbi:GtrA family protein [Ramlibacter sp.]|uniref:GtrA family protein n=1 Tax=Ramlibacter sp. TaxID=1917967 RepID=UPI002BADF533|nr:GtrA family protein [Ramlibacter sp.]HWI82011.1 GtrA family protein [Ramlibacter sp.]
MKARIGWFLAVGCAAAAVHFAIVVRLVTATALAPLAANVAGWLVALLVSFTGHWRLTFRHERAPWRQAAPRFFAISLAGFAVNEAAYAVLLHLSGWRYDVLLAIVLVGMAVLTYLLSSRWAFLGTARP